MENRLLRSKVLSTVFKYCAYFSVLNYFKLYFNNTFFQQKLTVVLGIRSVVAMACANFSFGKRKKISEHINQTECMRIFMHVKILAIHH